MPLFYLVYFGAELVSVFTTGFEKPFLVSTASYASNFLHHSGTSSNYSERLSLKNSLTSTDNGLELNRMNEKRADEKANSSDKEENRVDGPGERKPLLPKTN